MMWWPLVISVAFVVGIVVASFLWKRDIRKQTAIPTRAEHRKFPFKKVASVLSGFQMDLYRMLVREAGDRYVVFPGVKLQYIVALSRKSKREVFYGNLLQSRFVDFLICDRETTSPFLAIQILEGDQQNDAEELTAHVIGSADLPCLQLPVTKSLTPGELGQQMRQKIKERRKKAVLEPRDLAMKR